MTTPWIKTRGDASTLTTFCERCGHTDTFKLPISVTDFAALAKAFVGEHKKCRERAKVIPFSEVPPAYVVGPMTGVPRLNWAAFKRVWMAMLENGRCLPSMPHLLECGVRDVEQWLDAIDSGELSLDDIDADGFAGSIRHVLDVRPALLLLPGYADSRGTVAEIACAIRLGLPVFEVCYEDGAPVGVRPLTLRVDVVDCTSDAAHSRNCDTAPEHRNL